MNQTDQPLHLLQDQRLGREAIISPAIHKKEGEEVKGILTRIESYPGGDEIWYVGPYAAHAHFFHLVEKQEDPS